MKYLARLDLPCHLHRKKINTTKMCISTKCCINIYYNCVMSLIGNCSIHWYGHINSIITINLVYQSLATAKLLPILQMQRSLHCSIVWNRSKQCHHFIVCCNRRDCHKCTSLIVHKQVSCLCFSVYWQRQLFSDYLVCKQKKGCYHFYLYMNPKIW